MQVKNQLPANIFQVLQRILKFESTYASTGWYSLILDQPSFLGVRPDSKKTGKYGFGIERAIYENRMRK